MKEPLSKKIYAGLLIVFMAVLAVAASAGTDSHREKMHERKFERMLKKLELSDDQVQQAEQLRDQSAEQRNALREQIKAKREAIKAQSDAEVFDELTVETLAAELGDLQAQSIVARARHHYQFQQILTADQRSKMAEWQEKRGKHRGAHKGRRGRQHIDVE